MSSLTTDLSPSEQQEAPEEKELEEEVEQASQRPVLPTHLVEPVLRPETGIHAGQDSEAGNSPGLDYIGCEEPGELSQARALEVVDRFLDLNYMELDGSSRPGIHLPGGPQIISVSKGSRELAQRSVLKSTVGRCGIYDWDYTHEDASGEEFFIKRKELWFDEGIPKRRSLTEPGKGRFSRLGKKAKSDDQKVQDETKSNLRDPLYSDSRSMQHRLRVRGKTVCYGED